VFTTVKACSLTPLTSESIKAQASQPSRTQPKRTRNNSNSNKHRRRHKRRPHKPKEPPASSTSTVDTADTCYAQTPTRQRPHRRGNKTTRPSKQKRPIHRTAQEANQHLNRNIQPTPSTTDKKTTEPDPLTPILQSKIQSDSPTHPKHPNQPRSANSDTAKKTRRPHHIPTQHSHRYDRRSKPIKTWGPPQQQKGPVQPTQPMALPPAPTQAVGERSIYWWCKRSV